MLETVTELPLNVSGFVPADWLTGTAQTRPNPSCGAVDHLDLVNYRYRILDLFYSYLFFSRPPYRWVQWIPV